MHPLVFIDKCINVLLGGVFTETLSAHAHRSRNHPYFGWTERFIDALFFLAPQHCLRQYEYEQGLLLAQAIATDATHP